METVDQRVIGVKTLKASVEWDERKHAEGDTQGQHASRVKDSSHNGPPLPEGWYSHASTKLEEVQNFPVRYQKEKINKTRLLRRTRVKEIVNGRTKCSTSEKWKGGKELKRVHPPALPVQVVEVKPATRIR